MRSASNQSGCEGGKGSKSRIEILNPTPNPIVIYVTILSPYLQSALSVRE